MFRKQPKYTDTYTHTFSTHTYMYAISAIALFHLNPLMFRQDCGLQRIAASCWHETTVYKRWKVAIRAVRGQSAASGLSQPLGADRGEGFPAVPEAGRGSAAPGCPRRGSSPALTRGVPGRPGRAIDKELCSQAGPGAAL